MLRKNFDFTLFSTMLIIIAFGIAMIYSTTHLSAASNFSDLWVKQVLWFMLGMTALLVAILVHYRTWYNLSPFLYGLSIFTLLLCLFYAPLIRHTKSWLIIGPLSFQPAELAKVATIIYLARILSRQAKESGVRPSLFFPSMVVLLPIFLILKQPDIGSSAVFIPVILTLFFLAGAKPSHLASIVFTLILSLVLLFIFTKTDSKEKLILPLLAFPLGLFIIYFGLRKILHSLSPKFLIIPLSIMAFSLLFAGASCKFLKDYQQKRLIVFLNPGIDPRGAGYNIIQSKIAIGSGKFKGKGYLKGTQGQLGFLPEQPTDFIFSCIGEEFGFLGASLLLLLFAILIYRGLSIALSCQDMFGTLLSAGLSALIATSLFINIGVTLGLMPVTGLPLPLVSYGGSSLVATMFSIGLLLNVRLRRFG